MFSKSYKIPVWQLLDTTLGSVALKIIENMLLYFIN